MKNYIFKIAFLSLCLVTSAGCSSRDRTKENRVIASADKIKSIVAENSWTINLVYSTNPMVKVEYSAFLRDNVVAEVRADGSLHLSLKHNVINLLNNDLVATVHIPNVEEIKLSGASECNSSGIFSGQSCNVYMSGSSDMKGFAYNGNSLNINLSGSSDCYMSGKIESVQLSLSGSSDLVMKGEAPNMSISAMGSSDIEMLDFTTDILNVSLTGSSDMSIVINKNATGSLSGSSTLKYRGNADVSGIVCTGSSEIKKI